MGILARQHCRSLWTWLACGLLCIHSGAEVRAQAREAIKPPFGLSWGISTDRLRSLLQGAKARTVETRVVRGRECWVVEGLEQPGLRRSLFYFEHGTLAEVELQYEHDNWSADKYDEFLMQVKSRIEERYGPGSLIARSKGPEESVVQTVIGYQWTQRGGVLQLFYYSAEAGANAYRTLSLHYKSRQ